MKDQGEPFPDAESWNTLVRGHSVRLFPEEVWNRSWSSNGVPFIPMIRAIDQGLGE
jgi:hypothetical protein